MSLKPGTVLRALAILAVVPPSLAAQSGTTPLALASRGVVPNGSYAISQIESVDAVSGNLSIHIPITALPPGPGGFSDDLSLNYNASIFAWQGTQLVQTNLWDAGDSGGWRYGFNYALTVEEYPDPDNQPNIGIFRYRMIMPDGSSHVLHVLGYTGASPYTGESAINPGFYYYDVPPATATPESGTKTLYSTDGSYLRVVTSGSSTSRTWTLYLPDGRTVSGTGETTNSLTDRNGNTISITNNSATATSDPTTVLVDSLGRTITIDYSTANSQDTITQAGYGGQPLTWTVNWGLVTLTGSHPYGGLYDCFGGPCDAQNSVFRVVQSISYPTGLSHQFSYAASTQSNGQTAWGQMAGMTLPTGASVAYLYKSTPSPAPVYQATIQQIFPVTSKTLTWYDEDASTAVPRTETTSYSFPGGYSVFGNPDGGQIKHYFFGPQGVPYPQGTTGPPTSYYGLTYRTEFRDASGLLTKATERVWGLNPAYGTGNPSGYTFHPPGNPAAFTEIIEAASTQSHGTVAPGTLTLASARSFLYDRNGNQTQITESDWTSYSNITYDSSSVPTGIGGAITLRTTNNSFAIATTTSASGSQDDSNGYWNSRAAQLLNLVSRSVVTGTGPGAVTEFQYDNNGTLSKGNLTKELHWDSTLGGSSSPLTGCAQSTSAPTGCNAGAITHVYDGYGNPTSTTDALGNVSQLTYDSSGLCVTAKTEGSGARHYSYTSCDSSTGATTSETDPDHGIVRTFGYDTFARNTSALESGGGLSRNRTTTYNDSARQIITKSDLTATNDAALVSTVWYDQLGRVRQSQDAAGNVTQSRYYTPQSGGSGYTLTSNPYLTGSESTMGWTTATVDTLGRTVAMQHCSGTAAPAPVGTATCAGSGNSAVSYDTNTTYGAVATTTMDEAGVTRISYYDGLRRLTRVTEGNLPDTQYSYDALDNLTGVTQTGIAARSFLYSSQSRLTSASNPENGLSCYTYDLNGNLATKTQGGTGSTCPVNGGATTTYTYNTLGQPTGKTYTGVTTPSVTYQYNAGWPTSVSTAAVSSPAIPATARQNLSFDGLGRVTSSSQTTNGTTYTFSQYQYNLADGLTQMALPSGRTVMNGYDNAGRLCSVAGVASGATVPTPTNPCAVTPSATVTVYANSFQYSPNGATQSVARGDTLSENRAYNDRLETTSITVGPSTSPVFGLSLYYCPSKAAACATNNGNVVTATPASTGVDQAYGYTDGVNRLTWMQEGSNSQSWTYDNVGNRWVSGGSGLPQSSFMPSSSSGYNANNQLVTGSAAYGDGRGNQTAIGAYTFSYDAENRMTTGTNNGAAATYAYDGEGRRVSKSVGGITTVYVYDAFGNLAGEYGGTGTTAACTTCYLTTDQIGSTRLVTNAAGTVVERHDYMPFGEELVAGVGGRTTGQGYPAGGGVGATSVMFTGQYRDAEDVSSAMPSGLDYFGARFFSGAQGRFTSPDAPFADQIPGDPQSWNMYGYVRNNPLRYVDPSGRDCLYTYGATQSDTSITVGIEAGNCSSSSGSYVAGTIDTNSLTLNNGTIGYSYSPYSGADIGTGTIGLPANEFPGIQGQANYFGAQQIAGTGPFVNALGVAGAAPIVGLELAGAAAGAGTGEMGLELLSSQARNIQTIDTIIADHVTMSDLAGGAKEAAGFEVRTGSRVWNHIQELKDARAGLARAIKNLQGSLNDPSHGAVTRQIVQQAIEKGQTALRMIDAAIR